MRVGEGLALPLPSHLAAALGLEPGDAVEVRGPSPDGGLRYVPLPAEKREARVPPSALPTENDVTVDDVVRAVTSAPQTATEAPVVDPESEIGKLVARHAAALREVGP